MISARPCRRGAWEVPRSFSWYCKLRKQISCSRGDESSSAEPHVIEPQAMCDRSRVLRTRRKKWIPVTNVFQGPDLEISHLFKCFLAQKYFLGNSLPPPAHRKIQSNIAKSTRKPQPSLQPFGATRLREGHHIKYTWDGIPVASKTVPVWVTTGSLVSVAKGYVFRFQRSPRFTSSELLSTQSRQLTAIFAFLGGSRISLSRPPRAQPGITRFPRRRAPAEQAPDEHADQRAIQICAQSVAPLNQITTPTFT